MKDKKPTPHMPQKGHKQKPNHPWSGKTWLSTIRKKRREEKEKVNGKN